MSKKACIVIDMSEKCDKCIFNQNRVCCVNAKSVYDNMENGTKPNWCPLRAIPDKKDYTPGMKDSVDDYSYLVGKMDGWNNCINTILGDIK